MSKAQGDSERHPDTKPETSPGGKGGIPYTDPNETIFRRDLTLLRRSVAKGWEIPEGVMKTVPEIVRLMVENKNPDGTPAHYTTRERQSAIKLLSRIARDNIEKLGAVIRDTEGDTSDRKVIRTPLRLPQEK